MNLFHRFLTCCFIALLMSIVAGYLGALGYAWQHIGYGLNPWLAYPMAGLFVLGAIALVFWSIRTGAEPPLEAQDTVTHSQWVAAQCCALGTSVQHTHHW